MWERAVHDTAGLEDPRVLLPVIKSNVREGPKVSVAEEPAGRSY